ncbi:hypothetical protein BBF96_12010 [Anoxybacter fermentans]|uniref:Uncharacterized protein n=1 Tax=Anoxybacter fermentans TaxID=1323375 RepID=A0A3Q9HRN5_9FIRM|nr:hypothetical protein [Anoxybacter fermentans]AZR74055.1 hypothetical protein BBF96_12010 [Anoxybacter fermentans]
MEKEKRLKRARQHIFSLGLYDSGAKIAIQVMTYGLAKIHYLQEYLGYKPNAFFLGAPDLTITRNIYRFNQGIGYGGIISWGEGTDSFIPVDLKPNACGMLIGGVNTPKSCTELIQALEELKNNPGKIEGTNIKWDFNKSNHFINFFKVIDNHNLPPYLFVIHGAGDEFRGDNNGQFGLYIDKSKILKSKVHTLKTPFGDINYLIGEDAIEYFKFYQNVEKFARQRRIHVAHHLFDNFLLITDQTHQGLVGLNEIILGCHKFVDEETLFPLMLRADRPGYLIKGKFNLTEKQLENLEFKARAKELDIYHRLLRANILPHGGGYNFPDLLDIEEVLEVNENRYYKLKTTSGMGSKIVQHLRALPYEYRGQQVLNRTLELGLGQIYATLIPLFTLKI